jgi:hypothetical protein
MVNPVAKAASLGVRYYSGESKVSVSFAWPLEAFLPLGVVEPVFLEVKAAVCVPCPFVGSPHRSLKSSHETALAPKVGRSHRWDTCDAWDSFLFQIDSVTAHRRQLGMELRISLAWPGRIRDSWRQRLVTCWAAGKHFVPPQLEACALDFSLQPF